MTWNGRETKARRLGGRWLIVLVMGGQLGTVQAASPADGATVRVGLIAPVSLSSHPLVELTSVDKTRLILRAEIRQSSRMAIIAHVPAGRYGVTVRALGFREARAEVDVRAATIYEFQALLAETARRNTESRLQLVRTESPGNPQIFDQQLIETFPGEDVMSSIAETVVAPVIVDRISDGGLRVGEAALVGGPGGSWRQTVIALGTLDVTDPARPGTPLTRAYAASTEALIVRTSMLPVSLAGPGPALTLIPKAPAAAWHGGAMFGAFPNGLQSDNARSGVPPVARLAMRRGWSGALGGPLGARAGLFLSSRLVSVERLERDEPTALRESVRSVSANTIVGTGPRGRLQIGGTVDRTASPYAGRARLPNRDARESNRFLTVQATADRWTNRGTAWSASAGFAQGIFDPSLGAVGSIPVATVERLHDGSVPTLFDPFPGTRRRLSAQVHVEPVAAILGPRHFIAAGVRVGRSLAVTRSAPSPAVAELVGGIPARLWEYGYLGPEARWASTELAAYVTDGMMMPARLRVDAGVRVEMSRGKARDAANGISWFSAAPRIGVRWQPDAKGRFALLGGYSRYAHPLPLDYLAYGDPAAAAGRAYRWNDENGDGAFQDGERGVLVAVVGPGGVRNAVDPHIKQPRTDEIFAGIEGRAGPWSLRLSGVDRRDRHLVGSVNTGVQPWNYALEHIPDLGEDYRGPSDDRPLAVYDRDPSSFGQDRYLLTNPVGHDARYQGVEITIERSAASRWRTRFDAAAYRSDAIGASRGFGALENDPGIVGEVFENPNAGTYARGRPFFDRGYVVKWWNGYLAPGSFAASAVVRYQDGQPFARVVVVRDLNQGAEVIQAYPRGRTRFTFTLTVDARVEKTVRIGRARVAGVVEVFNLLNANEEVEEDVLTGPAFRKSTAVQPPRAARIALRLAF